MIPEAAVKSPSMNRLDYFKARLDATISPVHLRQALDSRAAHICAVDVRNGPASVIKDRIPGALQMPLSVMLERLDRLPRNRELVLYCWDTWCTLAAEAAVLLLERGFVVREMYGGMAAWKALRFPTEHADAEALAGQHDPLRND